MGLNDLVGSQFNNFIGGGFLNMVIAMVLGAVGIGLALMFTLFMIWKFKNWTIKVEFKLPRDIQEYIDEDGNTRISGTLVKEWGKGYYNTKKGVVYVKRKGKKQVALKPFDVKRYISGNNSILTLIQVGVDDYKPVLDESYLNVYDENTDEEAALIKAKIDTSESKSWKSNFERDVKSTYTIGGWLSQNGQLLGFGVIIMMIFVGFAIVIGRLPK